MTFEINYPLIALNQLHLMADSTDESSEQKLYI